MDTEDRGATVLADAVARSVEPMPRDARARVRARLVSAMETDRLPLTARLMRPAIAIAAAASLLGGVSYAAAAAAPGDLLYPVKTQLGRIAGGMTHRAAEPVRRIAPMTAPETPPAAARLRSLPAPKSETPSVKPKTSAGAARASSSRAKPSAGSTRGNGKGSVKSAPGHGSKNGSSKGRTQSVPRRVSGVGRSSKAQEAKK